VAAALAELTDAAHFEFDRDGWAWHRTRS
jgi:hypothetical protein